jgi:hypothetical protein
MANMFIYLDLFQYSCVTNLECGLIFYQYKPILHSEVHTVVIRDAEFLSKICNCLCMAVPWLKRLVAGFPPRRPGFDPRSGHVGFAVDKVALG